jgi:hypothetical protein
MQARRATIQAAGGAAALALEVLVAAYLGSMLFALESVWAGALLGVVVTLVFATIVAGNLTLAESHLTDDPKGAQRRIAAVARVANGLCVSAFAVLYVLRFALVSEAVGLLALTVLSLALPASAASLALSAHIEGGPNRLARRYSRICSRRTRLANDCAEVRSVITQLEERLGALPLGTPPKTLTGNGAVPVDTALDESAHATR